MKKILPVMCTLLMAVTMNAEEQTVKPPVAKKVPKTLELHGEKLVDDYGWLREKASAETVSYLEAENAYAAAQMKPHDAFVKSLYDEMLGRIKQTDQQVPYRKGGWWYYTRTEQGKQYPIFARKNGNLEAAEEIVLDVNKLAEGQKFMSVGAFVVSDDGNRLAYSTDNTGYRQYKLQVKDLRTGELLPDTAEKTGSILWAADNKTLFYTVENNAKRQWRLYRHVLGSKEPVLVTEEKDELYDLYADRSRSGDWIFVVSDSKTTNEVQLIPAAKPETAPVTMIARKTDHKYYPEHHGDSFFIMTNDAGINYRVVKAPVMNYGQQNWVEVIPYKKSVRIENVDAFRNHLVVRYREDGLPQFRIIDLRTNKSHTMTFPEPAYTAGGSVNEEFDTGKFRFTYQSMVTPASTYDYDLDSQEKKLLKRLEVLGGFDPDKYKSERIWAVAKDGTKIPMSVVYKKSINPRGNNPTLLYAYGSYGASMPASFSSTRISLLDRGVVYAIAHIRGGGDMGKEWHEQGRMMTKMNTFSDFIAAAEHLVKEKYTSKEKLGIMGGSAGGLLVGTVVNMRPDLFKAALVYVPFVDVINTMLDASLPLTTQEYIEWGNPNEKAAYSYMKTYDPYSNIEKKKYPAMLVRTSLNDSQVGYWEAAKWVAKLRANKTDGNPLLLLVNMGAGHGGSSGRYDKLKEDAFDYAWLLTRLGITK